MAKTRFWIYCTILMLAVSCFAVIFVVANKLTGYEVIGYNGRYTNRTITNWLGQILSPFEWVLLGRFSLLVFTASMLAFPLAIAIGLGSLPKKRKRPIYETVNPLEETMEPPEDLETSEQNSKLSNPSSLFQIRDGVPKIREIETKQVESSMNTESPKKLKSMQEILEDLAASGMLNTEVNLEWKLADDAHLNLLGKKGKISGKLIFKTPDDQTKKKKKIEETYRPAERTFTGI